MRTHEPPPPLGFFRAFTGFSSGRENKRSKPTISNAVVPKRHVVASKWYHLCLVLDVKIVQASPLQRGLIYSRFNRGSKKKWVANWFLVSIEADSGLFHDPPQRSNSIGQHERLRGPEELDFLYGV